MTLAHASTIAARAVQILHDRQLLDKIPKTKIAEATKVSRVTVSKRLDSNDITLSALISTAESLDLNPVEVLKNAIQESAELLSSRHSDDDSALAEEEEK